MTDREKELTINKLKDILNKFTKDEHLGIESQKIELNEYDYWAIDMAIKDLEQGPKEGHWIPLGNYDDYGNENSYKCSECGDISTYPDNFCPNCGARMTETKENEDKQ